MVDSGRSALVALSLSLALAFVATATHASTITLTDQARRLSAEALLVDGHNDLPWALRSYGDQDQTRYDLRQPQAQFHTDIPRLQAGGVGAQFWSVFVPSSTQDDGTALATTLEQIDLVYRMVARYPDVFEIARSVADVRRIRATGKIASLIGMEGGHSMENSIDHLRRLYDLGARYMTLTHSKNTPWADSCTDDSEHNGLTERGKDIIREMNRLGMFVDISHVSAKTMRDALEVTSAPVIFSHSSAQALNAHARNVPDDVLAMMRDNGGVVMVNFYSSYIRHGSGPTDVDTVVDHIDHIAQVAGVEHVGLGSDFDGVPTLPNQLSDVSMYPYLVQGLLNRGYSAGDIKKILGENLLRAFAAMEQAAQRP